MGTLTIVKVTTVLLIINSILIFEIESAPLRKYDEKHERFRIPFRRAGGGEEAVYYKSRNWTSLRARSTTTTTSKPSSIIKASSEFGVDSNSTSVINHVGDFYNFDDASEQQNGDAKTILPRRVSSLDQSSSLSSSNQIRSTTEKGHYSKITFANLLERAKRRRNTPTTDSYTDSYTEEVERTTSPTTTPFSDPEDTTIPSSLTTLLEFQTMSAMIVTRNVTSTRIMTSDPITGTMTDFTTPTTPPEDTTTATTTTSSSTTVVVLTTTNTNDVITTDRMEEEEEEESMNLVSPTSTLSPPMDRVPKKIDDSKKEDWIVLNSGKYHEINPGQYHESNPGQYHESNPGQYHESNPGQYHESNPGQYHESNPGQYVDPHKLEIRVKHTNDTKVYNVQSKVNEFIIGEYGTISKASGETINGVRYTAIDESVDADFIFETLHKYFDFSKKKKKKK